MATDLTKVTVNFTPKAIESMHRRVAAERLTRTEAINRSMNVYDALMAEVEKEPGSRLAVVRPDGTVQHFMIV